MPSLPPRVDKVNFEHKGRSWIYSTVDPSYTSVTVAPCKCCKNYIMTTDGYHVYRSATRMGSSGKKMVIRICNDCYQQAVINLGIF